MLGRQGSVVVSRLLLSRPLGKILTRSVHFRVTLDTLSGYPELWISKIPASDREDLTNLVFFACVSWCLELHSTNITQLTIHANALPDMWNIFQENTIFYIHSHINSVGCVVWKEVQDIRKHMQKSTKSIKCSLSHFPELLWTRVLDTH